jgi:GxxExxY protein
MEVHRQLGPGLVDSAYRDCLAREFQLRELVFQRDFPLSFTYKSRLIHAADTLDFVVEGTFLVHVLALPAHEISLLHKGRLVTHLKLADIPSGLLVNFNVENLRLGIKRAIVSRDGRFTEPAYSA